MINRFNISISKIYKICLFIFIIPISFAQHSENFSKANSIIGYIKQDTIWIAADNRPTISNDNITISTGCKIKEIGNYIVVASGFSKDFHHRCMTDTIINYMHRPSHDPYGFIDSFFSIIKADLYFLALAIEENEQITTKNSIISLSEAIFVIPYFDEAGFPRILYFNAIPDINRKEGQIEYIRTYKQPIRLDESAAIYTFGFTNIIDSLVNEGFLKNQLPTENLLHSLIKFQTADNKIIENYIDIVRITEDKIEWVKDYRKKNKCD